MVWMLDLHPLSDRKVGHSKTYRHPGTTGTARLILLVRV